MKIVLGQAFRLVAALSLWELGVSESCAFLRRGVTIQSWCYCSSFSLEIWGNVQEYF